MVVSASNLSLGLKGNIFKGGSLQMSSLLWTHLLSPLNKLFLYSYSTNSFPLPQDLLTSSLRQPLSHHCSWDSLVLA